LPYTEDDLPNPLNAYGRTKLEGERAIQASGAAHLIFRTTWVYATEGRNFLLTILRLATQREELKIVRDQVGAPTLGREIAAATTTILERRSAAQTGAAAIASVSGIYHMTAAGQTTWFDFANAILAEAAAANPASCPWLATATGGLPLIVRRVLPIDSSEYPTPARRPVYSVLSNARLNRVFSVQLPDWRSQLNSIFANPPA
jgi:dTDP-4-dehydrorhamnose reductase